MGIFFGWLIFSAIVGAIGSGRKIGFGLSFIASLILSPLIGLIITLFSESNSSVQHKEHTRTLMEQQNEMLRKQGELIKKMQDPNYLTEEELEKMQSDRILLDYQDKLKNGEITEEQYQHVYNNINNSHQIAQPEESSTIVYIVVAVFVFLLLMVLFMS